MAGLHDVALSFCKSRQLRRPSNNSLGGIYLAQFVAVKSGPRRVFHCYQIGEDQPSGPSSANTCQELIWHTPPTRRRSSSPAPRRWTGRSASSLSFSPLQFCHSCAAPVPSSDRSSFCGFLSGFPSDVPEPPCVWRRTGMSLCLCPPTRYCPSCRRSLGGPTGTGTSGSSFCCLLENNKELDP